MSQQLAEQIVKKNPLRLPSWMRSRQLCRSRHLGHVPVCWCGMSSCFMEEIDTGVHLKPHGRERIAEQCVDLLVPPTWEAIAPSTPPIMVEIGAGVYLTPHLLGQERVAGRSLDFLVPPFMEKISTVEQITPHERGHEQIAEQSVNPRVSDRGADHGRAVREPAVCAWQLGGAEHLHFGARSLQFARELGEARGIMLASVTTRCLNVSSVSLCHKMRSSASDGNCLFGSIFLTLAKSPEKHRSKNQPMSVVYPVVDRP